MTSKELQLVESPINGYMMYSYHLAVTFSHVHAWPWFFSNYVQLQCNPAQLELADLLDFTEMPKGEIHLTEGTSKYNPWLANSIQLDATELDASASSILQYIIDKINKDYYVETFVDEYHISSLFNGDRAHFKHRLLVYGYNEETRRLNIIGFDKNKIYRKLECTYEEFECAFTTIIPKSIERTRLFRPRENEIPPPVFDFQKLVALTSDYLASRNTFLDPDLRGDLKDEDELWYGLKTYQFLEDYIGAVIEKNVARPDIRGFFVFWEHKKCMLDRLKWMQGTGYGITDSLIDEYRRVVSLCERARNRVVLFNRGFAEGGGAYLAEVPRHLNQAKAIEVAVLEKLIAMPPPYGAQASLS